MWRLAALVACAVGHHDEFTWCDELNGEWWRLCRRRGCDWELSLGG